MQNKLQELTDKLYQEGLSKGKKDAEEMKSKAKEEAAKIISDAKNEAKAMLDKAGKDAAELKSKVENDLKMASTQTISAIKQQVTSLIISKAIAAPVKESLSDEDFVKSIISTIVKAFNASDAEPVALELLLPEATKGKLDSYILKEMSKEMSKGIEVNFSKQLSAGFKIGPKDGGYMISFTDNDFEDLLAGYLRPTTKKLLFG